MKYAGTGFPLYKRMLPSSAASSRLPSRKELKGGADAPCRAVTSAPYALNDCRMLKI
ncbi:hypothetical protein SAMN04487895_11260 [Paenibacillus sophorae]|uniref:Uncharacterized protein n=1 Tax=Paenibacillus sophorae TaxID=1333845 RepID=A0A1H8SQF4_9BACL|nr:hypothetical protein SAMN04487895_11260 [Paenibacillus sophorae]